MVENGEAIVAAECMVFLRKYNNSEKDVIFKNPLSQQKLSITLEIWTIMKIDPRQQKKDTPRMLIKPVVFEEKSILMLQDKKGALQNCL